MRSLGPVPGLAGAGSDRETIASEPETEPERMLGASMSALIFSLTRFVRVKEAIVTTRNSSFARSAAKAVGRSASMVEATVANPSVGHPPGTSAVPRIRLCRWMVATALGLSVLGPSVSVSQAAPPTQEQIDELRRQLEKQQRMLEELQGQLDEQKAITKEVQREERQIQQQATQAEEIAQEALRKADRDERELVARGQERVKLTISGQVNRAVNIADDGDDTKAYFVDNDASNSRIRLIGTAKATDDLTLGTRIEFALSPDESGRVSQDDESPGDFIDERWAEVSLHSKRFGKVSLGKGDTASNNSAEVDLSMTDVVQYSSIADIAGGLQFRDSNDRLTGIRVSDAFQNQDGLSRRSRLRYDTPTWRGFYLAGSAVSDQRWDGSLWWSGQGYGIQTAAAFAVSDPNEDNSDLRYDGSFSALHLKTGLNLTLSGGLLESDDGGDATNFYAKGGWLARLFSVGDTAFGLDYTRSTNIPAQSFDGYSIGAAAVQHFHKYGTEFYTQVRHYSLSNDNQPPGTQDITVGTVGARVKF